MPWGEGCVSLSEAVEHPESRKTVPNLARVALRAAVDVRNPIWIVYYSTFLCCYLRAVFYEVL